MVFESVLEFDRLGLFIKKVLRKVNNGIEFWCVIGGKRVFYEIRVVKEIIRD